MEQAHKLVHLVITVGPDKGRMFFIKPKREALIGRSVSCDLRLTDPGASQKHCLVRSAGDLVFVEDLKSSNGTLVNGERTTHRVLDANGQIEIGSSKIEVSWVETEKAAPLNAVDYTAAPTLMETNQAVKPLGRIAAAVPSTVVDPAQLTEFRAARELLGKTIGEFLLLETLGAADIGVIFRAKALKKRDEVALVLIDKASARNPELLGRFLRDTKTGLAIPHALRLLAVGETPEYGYLVTEMIKGRDLDTLLDAGRKFNPAQTIALLEPIGEALATAHAAGLAHGDVRPANILVAEKDQAVLLGLGLARRTDSEGKSIFVKKSEPLSQLAYLAPELTRAAPATPSTDIYGFGATLYSVFTRKQPFDEATRIELVRKIRWDELPRLNTVDSQVPAPLAEAIARALAKESTGRFATMPEFLAALKAALK